MGRLSCLDKHILSPGPPDVKRKLGMTVFRANFTGS